MVVVHLAHDCFMVRICMGLIRRSRHTEIRMIGQTKFMKSVIINKQGNQYFLEVQVLITINMMVNCYHGMKLSHVMGLYGGMKKPTSQKMRISAAMLDRRSINIKMIMPYLQGAIVLYAEAMERLVMHVSTNAIIFP